MNEAFYSFYVRVTLAAVSFVLLVSAGIYAATRRSNLVRQYCAAHLIALALGTLADFALVKYVLPRGGIPPAYMNALFLTPIAFFIGFSTYICHRDTVMSAEDVLLPIAPIVIWGCLVVFGWQRGMGDFDVLGAWFVAAGCGGVDLAAHFGPPALTRNPRRSKAAGYAVMLAAVYLILPRATS